MIKDYILQNWALILILMAFAILLKTTVFLDKKVIRRMYILIVAVFLLSISVYAEFYLADRGLMAGLRTVLIAVRYSATPLIIAMILFALIRKARWNAFIPAIAVTVINFISIYNGVVFSLGANEALVRGPLGYLPYIAAGLYSVVLVVILFRQSNKQPTEIIPILFLCFAFASGLIFPFIFGRAYSQIFCATIVIALFVYYVFSILQLTKKDALTGLLNRQAYYASVTDDTKDITALVSIDMNGLKEINDTEGHLAGDEALVTLANCFTRAVRPRQSVYRVGGDEFVIACRRTSEVEMNELIERIRKNVAETKYRCAIGCCYAPAGTKTTREMLTESDEMMYREKAAYYSRSGANRYRG